MAYENRTVQSSTANTLPTGTDPLVDNTTSGDVQAIKVLDGTAGSTTPVNVASGVAANALRTVSSTDDPILGALTETAPATDTASSGLNGRLQRIAQRITSLIAQLPAALGANGGLKIEGVASGTAVPISAASLPSHAVTNAGTFAVQVDNNPVLGAGTAAIGKLAANSGVDIGDVDVTSFPTTTHSADFDTGAGTDTTLAFGIAVPASGGAAVIPGDATAGLKVDLGADNDITVASLPLPSGASTAAKQPALGTAGTPSADVITVQGVTSMTALKVDGSAVTQPVSGTVTANAGTNLNTSALALETGGNLAGAATSLAVMDDWDNGASDGASVSGDVAHDGVDAGEPVKVGAVAIAHGANPTAVAAADRTNLYANRHGVQWTIGGHPNAKSATYITTGAQTDDNVMPAIAGGTKYAVTRITITLDEATTVGVAVRLGFGTANVPALGASAADAVDDILIYHPGLIPGGGITIGDGSGVLGVGADGAELRITCEAPTSGTLAVTITYFTIES